MFRGYEDKYSNFHYHTAISRELQPDGSKGRYVGQLVEDHFDDIFGPILSSDRGLFYLCGLVGMQFGVYKMLGERGLSDAYMEIKGEAVDVAPSEWTREQMRRYVRPSPRMMVEVY